MPAPAHGAMQGGGGVWIDLSIHCKYLIIFELYILQFYKFYIPDMKC